MKEEKEELRSIGLAGSDHKFRSAHADLNRQLLLEFLRINHSGESGYLS